MTSENLRSIRPNYWLPPKYLSRVLGKKFNQDVKRKEIGDIDSLVTLYTHDVVGYIDNNVLSPSDYYVTKTELSSNRNPNQHYQIPGPRIDYDYQIFSQSDHVNQLIYKNYFLPRGHSQNMWTIFGGFFTPSPLLSSM